jgi:aspartyl-tRNA(Asn)/glutamyl-tRNA(Gln) amidotransferase subunit A
VPLAYKDLCHIGGLPTSCGTRTAEYFTSETECTAVTRLTAAGAVTLGKLNMSELALGPFGDNPHHGNVDNPWKTGHVSGGSSSGSGAAVAAGLALGALGSDTGGSIRLPAACCGIVGIKPTYGRVSRAGVLPLSWSMDHVGPMTRTARDSALMLGAIAGYDPSDPTTSVLPVPDYATALTGDVKGLRVGLLRAHFTDVAAPEVRAAVETAARQLEGAGAVVDDVNLTHVVHVGPASTAIIASEALAYHAGWMRTRSQDYQPDVRERLRVGAFISGAHYLRAQQLRGLVRSEIDAALARRDVLLAPATPIPAPALGERETMLGDGQSDVRSALIRLTRVFNFSGHPAGSAPCGFTAAGLPIGLQLVGRPFDEATVLRVLDAYQRITDWHTRRPPVA